MGTPHINANDGDFAKVVLMPGDPLRAKYIAENFLHDVKQVTSVRNMFGFTGLTKNNVRISVMGSGMGMPSIGIYSYELFTNYHVEAIIRIGTCGSYQSRINVGDVLVAQSASTDSSWQNQFIPYGALSAAASFDLTKTAYDILKKNNSSFHVGNILSADIFYDARRDSWEKWAKLGIMGVEMESYALYCTAMRLNKKALSMLTVSDHFLNKEVLSVEERQTKLTAMTEAAIEVAEKFA